MFVSFIFPLLFGIYASNHGPHLNFLDVSLISIAVLFLVLMILLCACSRNDK